MKQYILALDQGTTSSRAIVFDKAGNIRALAQKEYTQIYPKPGWVEHNPREIFSSQYSVMTEVLTQLSDDEQIAAIGITNQRETTILWDKKTGEPVYSAICWQCRRTASQIETLKAENPELCEYIRRTTGLLPDPYFSASKIAWILDHVEGVRERAEQGEILFGTVDTWLIWNLTQGRAHVTDYTNASRTMLFDIHALKWDERILSYFGIPKQILPRVCPSSQIYGYANFGTLGNNIPIAGAAGDQQAALFGQCAFEKGDAKNTYGTGCFLLMNTGQEAVLSQNGLLTTIAATAEGADSPFDGVEYALEGSVFIAGAAIRWLRDGLRILSHASETAKICQETKDTGGVYLVPAFSGLGAPYWNPMARGMMVGLTGGTTREQIIRATLESIAYQTADVLRAMEEDAGVTMKSLKVDGGASANDVLLQLQADLLSAEVRRPKCIETTALGAAYLAGLAVGFWKDKKEIRENWQLDREFTPAISKEDREAMLQGWKRAVSAALFWAGEAEGSDR